MANSRSARKRIRAAERRHLRNRAVRSAVRTAVARARRDLVAQELEPAAVLVSAAVSALDKAAGHGVLHRRNAARRKSRLMRMAARAAAVVANPELAAPSHAKGSGRARGAAPGTGGVRGARGAPVKGKSPRAGAKSQTRATRQVAARPASSRTSGPKQRPTE
ncbi:MAG TPA: 30S ribosomal protein S20 [Verrucomicrobiae bacterium]|nr:30S ribosomal protein S20 [Verrucomicrobiae bacterium]